MEFIFQPNVYRTGSSQNLLEMLGRVWLKDHKLGDGDIYIISGFANYNGGVRFYPSFSEHINKGGRIKVIIGGSTAQRLSSLQVAEALLNCNADVYVVNRKRLLHAKCYGVSSSIGDDLIVTSGNFTDPGMSQNAEAAVRIDYANIQMAQFSWADLIDQIFRQGWDIYKLEKSDLKIKANPGWTLLYDEVYSTVPLEENQLVSMVVLLNHSDTVRIQANPGDVAGTGSQYFWLSKSAFDFFPALTEKNKKGYKNTYSCLISLNYVDLGKIVGTRVTFEVDNNRDFRLGTSKYRYTKVAAKHDLAVITRKSEYDYEIRIIQKKSHLYNDFLSYATTYIGGKGKRFGYISNSDVYRLLT